MVTPTHLHAMVVHFPIALLLVGFLADIIGLFLSKAIFRQFAFYLLILGTAGVVAAFLSGNAAGEGLEEGSLGKAMNLHQQAAQTTLWLTMAALLFRIAGELLRRNYRWLRVIAFLCFALSTLAVGRTGYLGGQLVFKHAAGVELNIGE